MASEIKIKSTFTSNGLNGPPSFSFICSGNCTILSGFPNVTCTTTDTETTCSNGVSAPDQPDFKSEHTISQQGSSLVQNQTLTFPDCSFGVDSGSANNGSASVVNNNCGAAASSAVISLSTTGASPSTTGAASTTGIGTAKSNEPTTGTGTRTTASEKTGSATSSTSAKTGSATTNPSAKIGSVTTTSSVGPATSSTLNSNAARRRHPNAFILRCAVLLVIGIFIPGAVATCQAKRGITSDANVLFNNMDVPFEVTCPSGAVLERRFEPKDWVELAINIVEMDQDWVFEKLDNIIQDKEWVKATGIQEFFDAVCKAAIQYGIEIAGGGVVKYLIEDFIADCTLYVLEVTAPWPIPIQAKAAVWLVGETVCDYLAYEAFKNNPLSASLKDWVCEKAEGGETEPSEPQCGDTDTDINNCGTCGNKCLDGQECTVGNCTTPAPGCGDTSTDNNNCGICGKKCPSGQQCTDSNCVPITSTPVGGTFLPQVQTGAGNSPKGGWTFTADAFDYWENYISLPVEDYVVVEGRTTVNTVCLPVMTTGSGNILPGDHSTIPAKSNIVFETQVGENPDYCCVAYFKEYACKLADGEYEQICESFQGPSKMDIKSWQIYNCTGRYHINGQLDPGCVGDCS